MNRVVWAVLLAGCVASKHSLVPGTYSGDTDMWARLISAPVQLALPSDMRAAIAPHDLIDGHELAGFWNGVAEHQAPSVIVIVGPDHFLQGHGITIGEQVRFQTTFGTLDADQALARSLQATLHTQLSDAFFVKEHSSHAHAPFLRRFLPNARVVPIMIRWATPPTELSALTKALHELLPADALVIASVDFSHYQTLDWASFHDESAWSTISAFELSRFENLEVDSTEALSVVAQFARLRGAMRATRVLHTNAERKRLSYPLHATSHQYIAFSTGSPAPEPTINILISGENTDAPDLTFRDSWRWHTWTEDKTPEDPRLVKIRGSEDRFFTGADAYLFEVKPGESIRRTIHGRSVVFAGLALETLQFPEVTAAILKKSADCVVVFAHRGSMQLEKATRILSALHGAGLDAVIGRGFGIEQPIEITDHSVLVPSLGTFVGASGQESSGTVLGFTWSPNGIRVRQIPLILVNGEPTIDLKRLEAAAER